MLASIVLAMHPVPPQHTEPFTMMSFAMIVAVLWFPVMGILWHAGNEREARWREERGL